MYIRTLFSLTCLTIVASTDVRLPPSITKQPDKEYTYLRYGSLTLPCEATGLPTPEFYWEKDGHLLPSAVFATLTDAGTGNLRIENADANAAGEYQCFAHNQNGRAMSGYARLTQAFIDSYPPNEQTELHTPDEGEDVKLICKPLDAVPKAELKWMYIDHPTDKNKLGDVPLDPRVQQDQDGHLHIANAVMGDSRYYMCDVYNGLLAQSVGGSINEIRVKAGDQSDRLPVNVVVPNSPVGLRKHDIKLKCFFKGFPTPTVSWRRVGGSLPAGRYEFQDHRTTMLLKDLRDADAGEYSCAGTSGLGKDEVTFHLSIDVEPEFLSSADRPVNQNYTEGERAHFVCDPDAKPNAEVTWYINGEELNKQNPGPRLSFSSDGRNLYLDDVCKDCPDDGADATDLCSVQCKADNKYTTEFADGYLNILLATTLTTSPVDVELEAGKEVRFDCAATSDPATPFTLEWRWNDKAIDYIAGEIERLANDSLLITTDRLDDGGAKYEGKYTCRATNGMSTAEHSAVLTVPKIDDVVTGASLADYWWIFLIVALIILLLLLIFCCCLCLQRNKGESYPVDEKERAQGNDPEKELQDQGYQDYQRPEDTPIKGSRASLSSTIKLDTDEEGSLAEYGDIDSGKFNEDGSFIGEYLEKPKDQPKDSQV